mgnify:CR=1 FL=1
MQNKIVIIRRGVYCTLVVILELMTVMLQAQSPQDIAHTPLLQIDYKRLITRADLHYSKPVKKSEEGQPIGNGRMGSLVWTSPGQIKMQINRVDVFSNNSRSNNFFERNTEYTGATAYVDLDFGEQVFTEPHYSQELSCYEGVSTIRGKEVKAQVMAWNEQDVMLMQVEDHRKGQQAILANLRMLRLPLVERGNHSAVSKLEKVGDYIVLKQEFQEDDYYCASAVVLGLTGSQADAEQVNESTLRLIVNENRKPFSVFIASAATFNAKEDVVQLATDKLVAAQKLGYEKIYQSNRIWWADFWKQSYVSLTSADGEADYIEQNYTYYLYVMASSSRGKYPTKFNGMLWATGGDRRQWGNAFWGANQSCLYNALFATNHLELLDPLFNMYSTVYPTFEVAARQQWGAKGIYIPETMGFDGVPELPAAIAEEMRSLYLMQKPWRERSAKFMDYAETKLPFLSRWNWKHLGKWQKGRWTYVERGDGPYGPVNHLFSRGAKIAYQYWQKYEYTRDKKWLRDKAYPMLKGVAEFYRNFPNVKRELDGKYHIYHINDNESIWGGHNTAEEISSMRGIFPVAIKAAEILGVDKELRPLWQEFLKNLAPLTTSHDYSDMRQEAEVWVGSLPPTSAVRGNGKRLPDGNTMPVWFFDLCNPGANEQDWKIANSTFDGYFKEGINKQVYPYVLSKLPVAGAILGRVDAVRYLLPNQLRRAPEHEVMPNRMDVSEGFYTTNIQRIGRAAEALQAALCFNSPEYPGGPSIVRVFHAWPKEWNAAFNLRSRNGFLVSSAMKQGHIDFVELHAQQEGTCLLQNPWMGKKAIVFRNGRHTGHLSGELLKLPANKGDRIVLVQEGGDPTRFSSKGQDL